MEPIAFTGSVGWSSDQFFPLTADADGSYGNSRFVYHLYEDFRASPFTINQSFTPTNILGLTPMAMSTSVGVATTNGLQLSVGGVVRECRARRHTASHAHGVSFCSACCEQRAKLGRAFVELGGVV